MGNTHLVLSSHFMGEKVEIPGDSQKSVHGQKEKGRSISLLKAVVRGLTAQ